MIFDVAIVGAGMAGASLAASLDPRLSVLLLEAEDHPGYHATGRSAAFWDECYGGPQIQPLTTASGDFLKSGDFLRPRGSLYIGRDADAAGLRAFNDEFSALGVHLAPLDHAQAARHVPGLKPDWTHAVYGRDCSDIDVAGLHHAYLAQAKRNGAVLALRAPVTRADFSKGHWTLAARGEAFQARLLVNAAGAWADEIAELASVRALGHRPMRRTIVQLRTTPPAPGTLPLVIDFGGQFYFKPESGGKLWLSPHDETPSLPSDVAAEELDVAIAIDRLAEAVDCSVETVERRWAGLRTFAQDRLPVYGHDPAQPAFFWCTGQGGFGIQTAPAAARLCAALIEGRAPDADLSRIDPAHFAPGRFQ